MHTYALGVMSDLLDAWIDKQNENEPFYISPEDVERINNRILKIQVPHSECSRLPRPISEKEHWKAYEFQCFLLHYGFIILRGKKN